MLLPAGIASAATVTFFEPFDTGFQPQGYAREFARIDLRLPPGTGTVRLTSLAVTVKSHVEARSTFTSLVDASLTQGGDYTLRMILLPRTLDYAHTSHGSLGQPVDASAGQTYTSDFTADFAPAIAATGDLGTSDAHTPLVRLIFGFNGLDYEGDVTDASGDVRFEGIATIAVDYTTVPEPAPIALAAFGLLALAAARRPTRAR